MRLKLKWIGMVPIVFLAVSGCSSQGGLFPSAGARMIQIDSVPVGADVYLMGEKAGITPMQVGREKAFPNTYPKEKESLYGKVMLRKEGCADHVRAVSSEVLDKGLRAQLDCAVERVAPATDMHETLRTADDIEQRLERVKQLLDKGVISEEEARRARARILEGL